MLNCNNCGAINENGAIFCAECGTKIQTGDNSSKNIEQEIELNLDLSFIKNMRNNQKYILILSGVILVSFFMPFVKTSYNGSQSLFDTGGYAWIIFMLPLVFFSLQYYYHSIKTSNYVKGLYQTIIIILTSMILSLYMASYFGNKVLFGVGVGYDSESSFTIGAVLSFISFLGILVLGIIENLNIFKKAK